MADKDLEFAAVSIEDFATGKPVPYAIYIRITSWKYLKIANPGDGLDQERLDAYKDKNVKNLYLTRADFAAYMGMSAPAAAQAAIAETTTLQPTAIVAPPQLMLDADTQQKLEFLKSSAEATLELMRVNGINAVVFDTAKEFVESTVSICADDRAALALLATMSSPDSSKYVYQHSLGTTLYSVMISRALNWKTTQVLHKIGMAGLMHDVGTNGISEKILLKPEATLEPDELKQLQQHSEWGG